jgi:hypothetical protein
MRAKPNPGFFLRHRREKREVVAETTKRAFHLVNWLY